MYLVSRSVGLGGDVHAEFADIVKRLLALELCLFPCQEFAVLLQLNRADLLRNFIAWNYLDVAGEIVVTRVLDEFVDTGFH